MTGATASRRSASRTTIHTIEPLPFALPYQYHSEADKENPSPTQRSDPLAQKQAAAVRTGSIAQRRYRHNEADVFYRKHCQHGKETDAHERKTEPHPSYSHRPPKNTQERKRPEIFHFPGDFHRARDAEFAGGAAQYDQRKQNCFQPHQRRSVVLSAVLPTKRTPRQIVAMPIQRRVLTNSPSQKWPSSATMA